jgi:hypothetical protein
MRRKFKNWFLGEASALRTPKIQFITPAFLSPLAKKTLSAQKKTY